MFHDIFVCKSGLKTGTVQRSENGNRHAPRYVMFATFFCPICFTICLFISPDLDGHRAPKKKGTVRRSENGNRPVSHFWAHFWSAEMMMGCIYRLAKVLKLSIAMRASPHILMLARVIALLAATSACTAGPSTSIFSICFAQGVAGPPNGQGRTKILESRGACGGRGSAAMALAERSPWRQGSCNQRSK